MRCPKSIVSRLRRFDMQARSRDGRGWKFELDGAPTDEEAGWLVAHGYFSYGRIGGGCDWIRLDRWPREPFPVICRDCPHPAHAGTCNAPICSCTYANICACGEMERVETALIWLQQQRNPARTSRYGYTSIAVLDFLVGMPWDEVARAYVEALRPSEVQVTSDGVLKSNARTWRVTVHLDDKERIEAIEQEVEVPLPDGIENGYEFERALAKRRGVDDRLDEAIGALVRGLRYFEDRDSYASDRLTGLRGCAERALEWLSPTIAKEVEERGAARVYDDRWEGE